MTNTTQINNLYPVANATASSNAFVWQFEARDPTSNDVNFPIQKFWLNTATNAIWFLKNFITSNGIVTANWIFISTGGQQFQTISDTANTPVSPTSNIAPVPNNIQLVGGAGISIVSNPSSHLLTISSNAESINYTNVTHAMSPYTVNATTPPLDYYISVDCSGGAVTLKFPNAPTFEQEWIVKDRTGNASTNHISITTVGGVVTIDGQTTYLISSNYGAVNLLANATPTYEVF